MYKKRLAHRELLRHESNYSVLLHRSTVGSKIPFALETPAEISPYPIRSAVQIAGCKNIGINPGNGGAKLRVNADVLSPSVSSLLFWDTVSLYGYSSAVIITCAVLVH